MYAVGDCNGKLMLAHAAMAMGEAAAENAMGGSAVFDAAASPSCAYIGPEFACVGLTEEDCAALVGGKVKLDLVSKIENGRLRVDQGVIAGCAGGTYSNICEAAQILEGHTGGNGCSRGDRFPGSYFLPHSLHRRRTRCLYGRRDRLDSVLLRRTFDAQAHLM